MNWFGEPWGAGADRAPVCEDEKLRVKTPVGIQCLFCQVPIAPGDRGVMMPYMQRDGVGVAPVMLECLMADVMGRELAWLSPAP